MASFSGRNPIEPGAFERRKTDRADLVVRVEYQTVDELFSDFSRDVNEGGIFVETDTPHEVGTQVDLQFRLPGEAEPVSAQGTVVRITDGGPGEPQGMGIEFDALAPESRQRIDTLVRNLRVASRGWAAEA